MARIVGGVAASHTPTIGFAYDQNKQDDPSWSPIFAAFKPVEDWFKEKRPDAIVYIFNDHVTSFFFDHYSAFTLGIGEEYAVADEGGNPRQLPAIKGDPKLAAHVATIHKYDPDERTMKTVPGAGGVSAAMNEREAAYAEEWARNIRADTFA